MFRKKTQGVILRENTDYDPETDLVFLRASDVHVSLDGCLWVDPKDGLLIFVEPNRSDVSKVLYYIGEEGNQDVVGIGRDIVAFWIDSERVAWLLAKAPRVAA